MSEVTAASVESSEPTGDVGFARDLRAVSARDLEYAALASALFGLLVLMPLPPGLRAVLLAGFILTGPGLAIVLWVRLPMPAAIAVVPATGMSLMVGATVALAWMNVWLPVPLLLILVAAVAGSALLHARRALGDRAGSVLTVSALTASVRWPTRNGPLLCVVAALVAWAFVLPWMSGTAGSMMGLLFSGTGPALVPIVAVLIGAFIAALRAHRNGTAVVAVGAMIVVLRVTATLITELPIYTWTFKHIGIVDYVLQNHVLPPTSVEVYREWPAFFTGFAWFSDLTSADSVAIAHWFAPVSHVVLAVMVGCLAMVLGLNEREVLAAVMVVEIANWVGQDYFSPQAYALPLALGVLTLLIAARTSRAAGYLAFLSFAAVVPTHQLTPYWVFGVVVLLVVIRKAGPPWIVAPYGLLLAAYLYPRRDVLNQHSLFSGANPLDNGAGNAEYVGTAAKELTSLACRGASAAVVVLAVAALAFWWRRRRPFLVPATLAFSSFILLFLNDYGGEAIFRVYLYALAGCAILIAPMLVAATDRSAWEGRHHALVAANIVLTVIAAGALQGYYGTWSMVVQARSQLTLVNELIDGINGPATIWNLHPAGLPSRPTAKSMSLAQYHNDFDTPIFDRWPGFAEHFPDGTQFDDVTSLASQSGDDTYFVFTDDAIRAVQYLGITSSAAAEKFESKFRYSPFWHLRYHNEDTRVYEFRAQPPQPIVKLPTAKPPTAKPPKVKPQPPQPIVKLPTAKPPNVKPPKSTTPKPRPSPVGTLTAQGPTVQTSTVEVLTAEALTVEPQTFFSPLVLAPPAQKPLEHRYQKKSTTTTESAPPAATPPSAPPADVSATTDDDEGSGTDAVPTV